MVALPRSSPSALGPERQRTRRQLDLLDRLVDLLVAEGFTHLTLDEVATRLRCSKTTLYALADSKADLAVEVVERWFQVTAEIVEGRLAATRGPRERMTAYLGTLSDRLRPLSRRFLTDVGGFRPTAEVYQRHTDAAADRIAELIAEGIDAGAFRPLHAGLAAEMTATTMFGIPRGEMSRRLEVTDAEAYDELASLLLHTLAAEG